MKVKDLIKSNPISIIFVYLISMVVFSLLGLIIMSSIAASKYNLEFSEVFKLVSLTYDNVLKLSDTSINCYHFVQATVNFIEYILMFILIFIFSLDYLKEDINKLKLKDITDLDELNIKKKNIKRFIIVTILGVIIFPLFNQGITELISLILKSTGYQSTSLNESLIEGLCNNGYAVIMGISIIFLAPFVEELVYRKSISKLCKGKVWLSILISSLAFALPHMLSDTSIWYAWILLFLNYALCGMALAIIYEASGANIYSSILAHTVSNLVSFIMIMVL